MMQCLSVFNISPFSVLQENIKKQREVLMDENEDLQKKINAIKASRAEKEPYIQQVTKATLRRDFLL